MLELIALREVVVEDVEMLLLVANEKGEKLTNNMGAVTAMADRNMVQTVIRNLISNALKFTPSGGEVEISAQQHNATVVVKVTDSGVGMSDEQMATNFALAKHSSTVGTAGEKGTGLGLPLCKEMFEKSGGEIWAESTLGGGSVFAFTIPMNIPR